MRISLRKLPLIFIALLVGIIIVFVAYDLVQRKEFVQVTDTEPQPINTIDVSTTTDLQYEEAIKYYDDEYEGGLNTYLFGDEYVSVEGFVAASGFPIYGAGCSEVRRQNAEPRTECRSVFFNADDMVQLYVPKNAGFLPRNRTLAFPDADTETFQFLQGFVGFDKDSLHFATYVRDSIDPINSRYSATSTPITPEEYQLLELFTQNDGFGVIWLRKPDKLVGGISVTSYADSLQTELRKDFVEISDANGPLLRMFGDGVHQGSIKRVNDILLYFGREGLYEIKLGNEPELLLDQRSQYMFHVSGSENVYYLTDYSGPNLQKFHVPTRRDEPIVVNDKRKFVRSLNIFVSSDELKIYTRVSWNTGTSSQYLPAESALLEIDTATGEILSEIPYEQKRHGSLYPFAVSPNGRYVYNIPVPYEGYMFDEMQYYERYSTGEWSASSTVFNNFRLEVGGGWNARTGQWLLSPNQSLLAISDAGDLNSNLCGGMGDTPSVQNQLKILVLDEAESVIVAELGPWEQFELSHWNPEGNGLFYRTVSFEQGACSPSSVSDLKFIKI